jgi:hypothetical protein
MSRLLAALVAALCLSLAVEVAPVATSTAAAAALTPADKEFWATRTYSPGHYALPSGPKFNNPYGTIAGRRRIISHVVRTINSVPGYRVRHRDGSPVLYKGRRLRCPEARSLWPATIRIALYSIADRAFTSALIAAHRRCVSVKILMNSHLNADTSPSWRRLIEALGRRPLRRQNYAQDRSFAYRCSNGCRGSSVLHTKMYLFDKVNGPSGSQVRNVTMTGSSNMTSNAVRVQWNDLFTIKSAPRVYGQYNSMFKSMVPDIVRRRPVVFPALGRYQSTFYPFFGATAATDKTMGQLRSIRCLGASGGAGINGRTVLYIVMHSWHGTRGKYLAERVRSMYNRGCYVRILYSFMGHGTFNLLTKNTGSRMVARRVLFPGPSGVVAAKYSHMKMFAASGVVAGDPSSWVTWTGSNNWADRSLRADEVTLRIRSRYVYRKYVGHWNFMRATRSSSVWAIYEEPNGGGRAPGDGG